MEGLIKLRAIERLRRVWLQHYHFSEGQVQWRSNDNLPPAGLMISSPYDEEARYARKGTTSWVGYKIHLTETCGTVVAETNDRAEHLNEPVSAELQDCAQRCEADDGSARVGRELPHLNNKEVNLFMGLKEATPFAERPKYLLLQNSS